MSAEQTEAQRRFIREIMSGDRCAECGEQHSPDFDCTYERRQIVDLLTKQGEEHER